MEVFETIWTFINLNILNPICTASTAMWNDVFVPTGNALVQWGKEYLSWVTNVHDFATQYIKFRIYGRVYSFMLILPIGIVIVIFLCFKNRKRKRKRRKDLDRIEKKS